MAATITTRMLNVFIRACDLWRTQSLSRPPKNVAKNGDNVAATRCPRFAKATLLSIKFSDQLRA